MQWIRLWLRTRKPRKISTLHAGILKTHLRYVVLLHIGIIMCLFVSIVFTEPVIVFASQ